MNLPIHAMIDTETLGVNTKAPITQIGIVIFTEEGIIDELDITMNLEEAFKLGTPDGSTVKWWLAQGAEAKGKALTGIEIPFVGATKVADFLLKHNPQYCWAHATFDFPIVANWFRATRVKSPIDFRACRDMRTIEHFFGELIEWEPRQGTHHSAIDDARFQTIHCIKMLRAARLLGKVRS